MTRKQRKQRRQDSKIARYMEKLLLRGTFQQELKDLHFEDIKLNGRILEALADKECMATMIGISLGLPADEVTLMIHDYEQSMAYNDQKSSTAVLTSLAATLPEFPPIFDKDAT